MKTKEFIKKVRLRKRTVLSLNASAVSRILGEGETGILGYSPAEDEEPEQEPDSEADMPCDGKNN
jgi:hypothetical protein